MVRRRCSSSSPARRSSSRYSGARTRPARRPFPGGFAQRYDVLNRLTSKWHPVEWTEGTITAGPSQGPRSSTVEADGADGTGGPWSNMSWIRAVDGADASYGSIGPFVYSNSLRATGFGFALPAGAVVRGVECVLSNVHESGGGGAVSIRSVRLIKGGTVQGDAGLASTPLVTAPGPTLTAGGAADLWGLTLTKADVEASDFGVAFQFQAGAVPGGCGLNAMRLIVHYAVAGENASRPTVHDLVELRAAVAADHAAAGLALPTWTDAEMVAGLSPRIRAAHFNELRDKIQALWTAAGLGAVPGFTGGAIVGSARRIKATDLTDLRGWLGQYESAAVNARARAVYRYDEGGAAAFALGRRTSMVDGSGTSAWLYDRYGRVIQADRTTDGKLYRHGYSYDALDRLRTHAYPDDGIGVETLTYAYGANTLLAGLSSSLGVSLASGVEYNHLNMPTRYLLGSSPQATARCAYWGSNLDGGTGTPVQPYGALRLTSLQTGAFPLATLLVSREMTYDPAGNVAQVADAVFSETIGYGYDDLDRLTSAGAPVSESFAYDAIGNMTARDGLPLAYGDAAHAHAVTAYDGVSYAYDASGNLTARTAAAEVTALQYNAENRLTKVSRGATVCRYTYDGDGHRTKRLDADGTVHYAGDHERNVGAGDGSVVVTKYYRALGRLVAFRKGGALHWVGTDHLGGTIRTLDATFNAVDSMRYKPYGTDRDAGTNLKTDRKFTGQTEDKVSGLYFYKSRYYDARLGRFVQPDSVVPAPTNPQSLNRYSYVLNNPLRYSDPTGHYYDGFQGDYGGDPSDPSNRGSGATTDSGNRDTWATDPEYPGSANYNAGADGSGGHDTAYPEGDPGGPDSGSANQPPAEDPWDDYSGYGSPPEQGSDPTTAAVAVSSGSASSPATAGASSGTRGPVDVSFLAPTTTDPMGAMLGATATFLDDVTFPPGTRHLVGTGLRVGARSVIAAPAFAFDTLSTYRQELDGGYGHDQAALLGLGAGLGGVAAGAAVGLVIVSAPVSVPLVVVIVAVGAASYAGSKAGPELLRPFVGAKPGGGGSGPRLMV